jgi:hypothetical protein
LFPFNETTGKKLGTNLLYDFALFKNEDIRNIFAFVFFRSPSPTVIFHMKDTQKEERLREMSGWSTPLELGVLEPNKTMAKESWPLSNTITIFSLGKVF